MELYEHGTQSLAIDNTSILQLTNGALQGPHLITTNKIIALQQTYVSPDTLELFLPPQHGLLFILGSHDKMTNTLRKKWHLWCYDRGFYFEWMNYAAACRTLPILLDEKRLFSILLLPC